jgi:hypothetical protein
MYTGIGRSIGTDYFRIADQLTGEELSYLQRTRDFIDNDVLHTHEGTGTIQTLIIGRDITGASAFA